MQTVRETDNLYRLTRLGVFNCFLVRENDELTLVDTNLPGSADAILQAARSLGYPIARIALTHAHFDHIGSLDALTGVLPDAKLIAGTREARLLRGDLSLDAGESGKPLFGFRHVHSQVHTLVNDGDQLGSLRVVACPGHTPGHIAFLDCRDNSLLAGDSFMTQKGVMAAGTLDLLFPMPAIFSWNNELSARSAARLAAIEPSRLAVGHGKTVESPAAQMERAAEIAIRQHPGARNR
jgi:glyoxylase-like metal-dependent hydrolase (beta-lactamase superfamily II)